MDTEYYILDENNQPLEVSEEEHEQWVEKNAAQYSLYFKSGDGSRECSVEFNGVLEPYDDELKLFVYRNIFRSADGEIVDDDDEGWGFDTFEEAKQELEEYLMLNGYYEEYAGTPNEKGRDIEFMGFLGAGKKERLIKINTRQIQTWMEYNGGTEIHTSKHNQYLIRTNLSIDQFRKLIEGE